MFGYYLRQTLRAITFCVNIHRHYIREFTAPAIMRAAGKGFVAFGANLYLFLSLLFHAGKKSNSYAKRKDVNLFCASSNTPKKIAEYIRSLISVFLKNGIAAT